MAIAANNRQHYASGTASLTHTLSYTVGSGATLLLVKISLEINDPVGEPAGVSDVRWGGSGGTQLTLAIANAQTSTLTRNSYIYYLVNPSVATQDVWVSITAPSTGQGTPTSHLSFEAVWFSGTDTSTPIADSKVNTSFSGTTISASAALVPSGTDNWLETVACGGNNTLSIAAGQSQNTSVDLDIGGLWRAGHSWLGNISSNITPTWTTGTSQTWGMSAVLIAPSTAAAPNYTQTKFIVLNDDGTGLGEPAFYLAENWTGANGAAWAAARWTTGVAGGTAIIDIQSNQGRLQPNATHTWARALANGPTFTDLDMAVQFTLGATGSGQFHWANFRHSGGWNGGTPQNPQNSYRVVIWNDGANKFTLSSVVSGTGSTLASPDNKTWGTGLWNLRIRVVGTAIKVRAWQGSEPGTWDIEVTNSDHSSGAVSFASVTGASQPISWDNLSVVGL